MIITTVVIVFCIFYFAFLCQVKPLGCCKCMFVRFCAETETFASQYLNFHFLLECDKLLKFLHST